MKKHALLFLHLIFMGSIIFAKAKTSSKIYQESEVQDSIIMNITISDIYSINGIVQNYHMAITHLPTYPSETNRIPLRIHVKNISSSDSPELFLQIAHDGPSIIPPPDPKGGIIVTGALIPPKIPPTGGSSNEVLLPSEVIVNDLLPQPDVEYLFDSGSHSLFFTLSTKENELIANNVDLAKGEIGFFIAFSQSGLDKTLNTNTIEISTYPNPFISEIHFDFKSLENQKESIATLFLYDQYGILRDKTLLKFANDNRTIYQNNTLQRGVYFYRLEFANNQIFTGRLVKQ